MMPLSNPTMNNVCNIPLIFICVHNAILCFLSYHVPMFSLLMYFVRNDKNKDDQSINQQRNSSGLTTLNYHNRRSMKLLCVFHRSMVSLGYHVHCDRNKRTQRLFITLDSRYKVTVAEWPLWYFPLPTDTDTEFSWTLGLHGLKKPHIPPSPMSYGDSILRVFNMITSKNAYVMFSLLLACLCFFVHPSYWKC